MDEDCRHMQQQQQQHDEYEYEYELIFTMPPPPWLLVGMMIVLCHNSK
jgi:hypothetical protein